MMNVARRRNLNDDFVRRSFRDVADHDYILARAAFRLGAHLQVVTLGHQAIERYLKAILLFNDIPTKQLKHDIGRALAEVRAKAPFVVNIPTAVDDFVARLNRQASRYFENSFGVTGRTLVALDQSIWHIRRYCRDFHRINRADDGAYSEEFVFDERINSAEWLERPNRFRHFIGVLEDVLRGANPELRRHLVWRNVYYGRSRKVDPLFVSGGYAANPTLTLHPDAFSHFDALVQFSADFRKRMRDGA